MGWWEKRRKRKRRIPDDRCLNQNLSDVAAAKPRRLTPNLRCHLRILLRNPDLRLFVPTKSASRRSTIRPDSRSDSKRDATPRQTRKWNRTHSTLPARKETMAIKRRKKDVRFLRRRRGKSGKRWSKKKIRFRKRESMTNLSSEEIRSKERKGSRIE